MPRLDAHLSVVMRNLSSSDPLEGPHKGLRHVIELALDLDRGHHGTDREPDGSALVNSSCAWLTLLRFHRCSPGPISQVCTIEPPAGFCIPITTFHLDRPTAMGLSTRLKDGDSSY